MATQPAVGSADISAVPRLWDIKDVSAFLGVPVATIYQFRVRSEGSPAMRLGRHLRFDPETVATWAHQQQDPADARRRS